MKTKLISFFMFLVFNTGFSQDQTKRTDSSAVEEVIAISPERLFKNWPKKLSEEDFYFSNDLDPAYLLRGKIPGMLIARPGADPTDRYTFKTQGMASVQGYQYPLILVDGFPVLSMDGVDPLDIESFEVLQDIALTSQYGLRGSSGVIKIHTREAFKNETIRRLTYKAYGALDLAVKDTENLDAKTFREEGGTDLGDKTDWWGEITRPAFSTAHRLSLAQKTDNVQYSVSGNYRTGDNILVNTGYQQMGLRLHLNQRFFKERLRINLSFSALSRKNEPGFDEAFKYAFNSNPTAPVFDPNNTAFGGYHEQFLFDVYNPVSIIEQNWIKNNRYVQQAQAGVEYLFFSRTWAGISIATEKNDMVREAFYPSTSLWIGDLFFRPLLDEAYKQEAFKRNRFLDAYLKYNDHDLNIRAGYRYQEFEAEGKMNRYSDFATKEFEYQGPKFWPVWRDAIEPFGYKHQVATFYGNLYQQFDEKLSIGANYNFSGAGRLGKNARWSHFGGLYAEAALNELFDAFMWNINLLGGFGIAGNLPRFNHLSEQLWEPSGELVYYDGAFQFIHVLSQIGNPELESEKTKEWNFGLRFPGRNWELKLNYFYKKTTGLIEPIYPFGYVYLPQWINFGELSNNGFEVDFSARMIKRNGDFQWNSSINLYAFKTKINKNTDPLRYSGDLQLQLDEQEVGGFQGFVFTRFDEFGLFEYEDGNGDNNFCHCPDEFQYLGSTLPKLNIGWQNTLRIHKLEIMFSFYASLGHHVINERFVKYGSKQFLGHYNLPQGSLDGPLELIEDYPQFSSYFFEKATFLRLEHLTFRYPFITKNDSKITAYLGLNNLVTFSKYSGGNPETRVDIHGYGIFHGVDFAASYPMTRSFILGVEVELVTKPIRPEPKPGETIIME